MDNSIFFEIIGTVIFAIILLCSSYVDIKERRVSNFTYLALFSTSFISRNFDILQSLLAMGLIFIPMFICGLIRKDLGGGDIKFCSLCAFFIASWELSFIAVIIGCVLCIIIVPIMKKKGRLKEKTIPLIPFFSVGFFSVSILKLIIEVI